jgi:predicted enzyme related to lactoylglutathione lyase
MSNHPQRGRFVWHELVSTDVAKSVAFYTQLLGWKTKEVDMGPMKYTLVHAGDQEIAGMMAPPMPGIPSHWVGYMGTDDVDATAAKIKELGGKIHHGPMDIPNVGRFAVAADKEGAVFAAFKGNKEAPAEPERPAVGTFCWSEVMADNPKAAAEFYAKVFDFKVQEMDMGPMGTYRILARGERQTAGVMNIPEMAKKGGAPSHWLHYIHVTDVDASTRNAREIGAKVLVEPTDIPNIGRFSVLEDPAKAVVALFKGK